MRGFRFELQLAARFLLENRSQTILILLGIAVGVGVMVFLSALIDGLQSDLIKKTVGNSPHIIITREVAEPLRNPADPDGLFPIQIQRRGNRPVVEWIELTNTLKEEPQFTAVVPVIDGPALLRSGSASESVALRGMKLEEADQIYQVSDKMIAGSPDLAPGTLLVGSELADQLDLQPGDTLTMEIPGKEPVAVLVGGIFDLGVQNLNKRWVIMERSRVGYLLGLQDRITEIEVQVKNVFQAEELARTWASRLPGYQVESWQKTNASLLTALRSQSNSSYTIQLFVLLAVILGISSVLAINAVQKTREIGILKAIGIRTRSIELVFVMQGALLGTGGALAGTLLGIGMARLFILFGSEGYKISLLLKPATLAIVLTLTILSSVFAAFLPARRVARMNPIEVIRNG